MGTPAIEARSLSKVFGAGADAVRALDDVSLTIRQNEFFTLLGPSGCGKTTLLRLIGGFEQPSQGDVFLEGQQLTGLPPFKRPINTVFQSYALFPHLTVGQNIAFGLEMLGRPKEKRTARVEQMLALVKLQGYANRKPAQLSGGQQQRVALARALASQPKVLLLDEPLSALDLKLRKEMQIELKRLQTETGITFVFVTHDQEEALTMSDRIAVMDSGKILQIGSPTEIYEHPQRRFVADFIGETNFLEGRITEANGAAVAQLACGHNLTLNGPGQKGSGGGQRVTLAVRPERAEIVPPQGEGLPATVGAVVYMGTDTTYHLTLADGTPFTVRSQNHEGARLDLASGAAVKIRIAPAAIQRLAD
ncbi:ABC transporter ATP-binding protein [Pelagibius marinus]|uniref:ABC transporter ATP-binding protein n=1 Tax=Pelagibius marinus TaxID=2762760 RepID=UPI002AC326C0|nr:ABC transporter ATP-binding protein [Pelagibius marinus]